METKQTEEDIIDSYTSNEAVNDGLLFDFNEINKLGFKSKLISYATSNLLFNHDYLKEDHKEILK
jgi:hypothetical protein